MIDRAKADPEEFMGDVAALYPEIDESSLRDMLARVLFVADTWERLQGAAGDA